MARKTLKTFGFSLLVICMTLLLCELACRFFLIVKFDSPRRMYTRFGYDRDPLLGFDMIPDVDNKLLTTLQTTYSTNSKGFRGKEEFGTKEKDEVRTAILGGSSVFGYGASSDQTTIASHVKNKLEAKFPSRTFSVINAGNPGYTSYQVLAKLQLKVFELEPDFLVFYLGWNDLFFSSHKLPFERNSFYGKYQFFDLDSWQIFISNSNRRFPYRFARPFATTFVARYLYLHVIAVEDQKRQIQDSFASEELVNEITAQFYENLSSIAAISRYREINTIFITLMSDQDLFTAERKALNAVIKRVAGESGSRLIDADSRVISGQVTGVNLERDEYHLTDKGNEFLAGLIVEEISESLSQE